MNMEDKILELNKKVIDLILTNTGVDVRTDSRKRNIIELRSLYFTIIKVVDKKQTLEFLGNSVNRDHSSVLHNLKTYPVYERYNPILKPLKHKILSFFTINDEKEDVQDSYSNQIDFLKRLNSKLIDRINQKQEEVKFIQSKDYEVIDKLNQLLLDTEGTELHDLMKYRLEALYNMNSKLKQ
jgi:hypothetical protein